MTFYRNFLKTGAPVALASTGWFMSKAKSSDKNDVTEKPDNVDHHGHHGHHHQIPKIPEMSTEDKRKNYTENLLKDVKTTFSPIKNLISEFNNSNENQKPMFMNEDMWIAKINRENQNVLENLKKCKFMANQWKNFGKKGDADALFFEGKPITLDRIEKELKATLNLVAANKPLLEKYPTIYTNVLSCIAEFNLELKHDYEAAKFLYSRLNYQLINIHKYPLNNNAVLETGFKSAQCYLAMKNFKEFAQIMNFIEGAVDDNIKVLEDSENGKFSKIITKRLKERPKDYDYFGSLVKYPVSNFNDQGNQVSPGQEKAEITRYYLDTLCLKGKILELWVNCYYNRGIQAKQLVKISDEACSIFNKLYDANDFRVINITATYALCCSRAEQFTKAIQAVSQVEDKIRTYSALMRQDPPDFAKKFLIHRWNEEMENGQEENSYAQYLPFDDLNPREAILLWVLIGVVYLSYGINLKEKPHHGFRLRAQSCFEHAEKVADRLGDEKLIQYVKNEKENGKNSLERNNTLTGEVKF